MTHTKQCSVPPSLLFTLPLQQFTHAGTAGFFSSSSLHNALFFFFFSFPPQLLGDCVNNSWRV